MCWIHSLWKIQYHIESCVILLSEPQQRFCEKFINLILFHLHTRSMFLRHEPFQIVISNIFNIISCVGKITHLQAIFVVVAKVLHKPTWPLPPPPPTKIHLLITLLRNSVTSKKAPFDMSHQPDDMTWLWHHYLSDSILFRFEPIIYCPAMFLLSYII